MKIVQGLSATVHVGDRDYTFQGGEPLPDDTPAAVAKEMEQFLRDDSELTVQDTLPPEVGSASVEDLAKYITAARLTGPQTVELAADDPVLAAKVLEAEDLAHGGDGRGNVKEPLAKIAAA